MFKKDAATYRKEGLSMMQASKLAEGRSSDGSSKLLIAGLSVVAVGCLAFIGVQQLTGSTETRIVYSAAPPSGTAFQQMMALKVPHDREREQARLALLRDNPKMEVQSLEAVEELVDPAARRAEIAAAAQAAQAKVEEQVAVVEEQPVVVEPEVTEIAAVEEEPAPAAAPLETAALETEAEPITDIETLRASVSPELLDQSVLVAPCFAELQQVARNSTIFFPVGSAQLTGQDLATISRIGRMVEGCQTAKVHVTGHSDTTGNDLTNLDLSWKRADNTVAAMGQLGIDTTRFEPVGFGARAPLAQGDASDEDRNRRVEFVILKNTGGN